MTLYRDGDLEPITIRLVGGPWKSFWLQVNRKDGDSILIFNHQARGLNNLCGTLCGDSSGFRLEFDYDGWVRSYFKVMDPDGNVPIGTARCLKETARKIVDIQMRQSRPK